MRVCCVVTVFDGGAHCNMQDGKAEFHTGFVMLEVDKDKLGGLENMNTWSSILHLQLMMEPAEAWNYYSELDRVRIC